MDIAASIQLITETIIIRICKYASKKYKQKNMFIWWCCFKLCGKWKNYKEKIFDDIWIQPASGDAGGSLGAALAYHYYYKK